MRKNISRDRAAARRTAALDGTIDSVLVASAARNSRRLKLTWPKLSAATLHPLTNAVPLLLAVLAFAVTWTEPGAIGLSIAVVLPSAFRVLMAARDVPSRSVVPATKDNDLPLYSVIAPLHGEAKVVDQLLTAIERLDYPAEKLDVILAVEADDHETRAAITARRHRIPITVIPVPPSKPRTKPKALNVALEFARGAFAVIYDAEDRPEPNQLRCAVQAFRSDGNDLACVQARLCTDSTTSWLSRYFTAEYAGHFDVVLPALAALGLPLPLGGSSNHFRTATLRKVGGWDPYNVTEDADLGMRLARLGYRCGVIDSTTYEEAPLTTRRWLGQRSRWFKGWMRLSRNLFLLCFQKLEHVSTARRNVIATMWFVRLCSCTFATTDDPREEATSEPARPGVRGDARRGGGKISSAAGSAGSCAAATRNHQNLRAQCESARRFFKRAE